MKQIIEEEDLAGKTILKIGKGYNIFVLFFTDDTYAVVHASVYDSTDIELYKRTYSLDPYGKEGPEDLLEIGAITQEVHDKVLKEIKLNKLKEKEKNEIVQYKILKEKYGAI